MAKKTEKAAETPINTKVYYTYSKVDDIAKFFGVTVRRIQQLTQEGILPTKEVKTMGKLGRRYHTAETIKAYMDYLRSKTRTATGQDMEEQKLAAEIEIKRAKAEMIKLELAELNGEMHRSEDVRAMTTDLILNIRSNLQALPGQCALEVAEKNSPAECSEIIKKAVEMIMDELADYQYDEDKYHQRVKERQGNALDDIGESDD